MGAEVEGDDVKDVFGEFVGSSESLSDETAAMPQRPSTQPPMRRPNVEALRGPRVAVEPVLVLSVDTTDAVSDLVWFPAAMEASNDWDLCSELVARSTVMAGAEITGGVDNSSTLGDKMRLGIRMPGCQSPIRLWRLVGVWMSIPATETESKLSWEEDLRKDEGCTCMVKMSSSVVVSGSPVGEK